MKLLRMGPLVVAAIMAVGAPARASSPMGVYARVDQVIFEPTEAGATRAQVHGAFALHKGPPSTGFDYAEPVAGYMYFTCPPGQEAECRQQWQDIKGYIGKQLCAGFGQQLRPFGTVRPAGTPPSQPDSYDLGMGVSGAVSAGGMCPRLLAFQPPPTDGGVGSDGSVAPPPPPGPTGSAPPPPAPTATTPAPGPSAPAAGGGSGGCSATESRPVFPGLVLAAGLLGLGAVARRRSRRG